MVAVTVEDCVDKVPNRFELVLLAAHRARAVSSGAPISIERDNDKNPVVALREIAEQTVSPEDLKEDLIHSLQAQVEVDEPEAEAAPALPSARPVNVLGPDNQFSDAGYRPDHRRGTVAGPCAQHSGKIRKRRPLEGVEHFPSFQLKRSAQGRTFNAVPDRRGGSSSPAGDARSTLTLACA